LPLITGIACTAVVATQLPISAAPLTFNFSGTDNGLTTITKTVSGVTITLNNFSPTATVTADSDGICVAGLDGQVAFCPNLSSFQFSFSAPVQLISYQVGFISNGSGDQGLTFTEGVNTSFETNFVDVATTNFSTQFGVDANAVITASRTTPPSAGFGSLQIRQLTVDDSFVPVPGPLPVLGVAAAFGASRKLRARIRSAQPNISTEA
jgi:hypothetical protein